MASGCRVEMPSPPRHRRVRPVAKVRRPPEVVAADHPRREKTPVDRLHPHKAQLTISLTQETSKLRKDLAKVIVLDIVSGQSNEEILLEFLPGALNTPRVDEVYVFRGNSFLATLCNEEEAIKASKIGDLSLPSRLGPCVMSISPWSAEVRSVGAASGKGQVLLIWNLLLHAWTWTVLVDLLHPIGELVAIPQPSKPHKAFLSVLVRCHHRTLLPCEVSLSFGMRKFVILITDNKLSFPTFRRDLEKFVYTSATLAMEEAEHDACRTRFTHELTREAKGKEKLNPRPVPELERESQNTDLVHNRTSREGGNREWRPHL